MGRDAYADALQRAHAVAIELRQIPFANMLAEIEHVQVFAPVVGPAGMRERRLAALAEDQRIVEILTDATRKLEALFASASESRTARSRRPYSVELADALANASAAAVAINETGDPSRTVFGQVVL
jgi:hypothetical protein